MRRILKTVILTITLVLLVTGTATAEVINFTHGIELQYVSTNLVTVTFKIDSKGNSSSQVDVRINPSYSSVDTVKATVKIIDKKTGAIVKTWNSAVMDGPTPLRVYTFYGTHQIKKQGTYYIKGTLKIYDGGKLVETVSCESAEKSF